MKNESPYRVSEELYLRSIKDSADYIEKNIKNTLVFFDESKKQMYAYAINNIKVSGYIAEFGVWEGKSINLVAAMVPNVTVYGFDSFLGLPEDWAGWSEPKGTFNINGELPKVRPNVSLIKGLFKDSLPVWLKNNKDFFSLLIIDCDIYSSTKEVFDNIGINQIKEGTIILFDEYFGYINWREHEFKAWQEFVKKHNIEYKYLAINHLQALIEIVKIN